MFNSALSRRIHLVDLMLDQIFLIEEKRYNLTTVDSLIDEIKVSIPILYAFMCRGMGVYQASQNYRLEIHAYYRVTKVTS